MPEGRIPPQNIEAELSVLGAMMLKPSAATQALELLRAEDFYRQAHRAAFDAMEGLVRAGEPVDIVTVTEALRKSGLLEQVGGISFLANLTNAVPSTANLEHYAKIVKEKAILRSLIDVSTEIAGAAYEAGDEIAVQLSEAERKILAIAGGQTTASFIPAKRVVFDAVDRLNELSKSKGGITGLSTGLARLDSVTRGLQKSDLIIVAARPAMGKTAFVLNVAAHAALEGKTVAFFSLEMPREQLMHRIFCAEGQIDATHLARGELDDAEWERLVKVADRIMKTKLYFDDTSSTTVTDIRSRARRLKAEHGLDLIAIDYLQLIQAPGRVENRTLAVAEMTRSLKILARELSVPIVVLSQLSRATEGRSDKRPMLSDLRESGSIEQDADIVMFLYREDYYNQDTENANITELSIAKHRNGATDTVKLYFQKEYTRFRDLAREP
ncbi:replicative DNA helicase [Selenomonas sp. F0473]|uniref:replicative DNA helicase n=1 Tax=Selenomonas sp. F0473 TaxID=999423 RepID=UPI00029E2D29|nr:replicative DNA helicase [Selenomonas sp. F0473]EKU71106.1 replicative DNA helicase [Selenomonas sp. F0473]